MGMVRGHLRTVVLDFDNDLALNWRQHCQAKLIDVLGSIPRSGDQEDHLKNLLSRAIYTLFFYSFCAFKHYEGQIETIRGHLRTPVLDFCDLDKSFHPYFT